MIKRILLVFIIYGLFVAIVLNALGLTQVDMSTSFRALLSNANRYFNEYRVAIPNIPVIPPAPESLGNLQDFIQGVLNALNFIVGVLNFVVMILNGLFSILQFVFWFVASIVDFAHNGAIEIEDEFAPVSIQPLFPITDFPVFPIW